METAYDGRQVVGMDLHRRRSVLVRMTEDGRRLGTARITNSAAQLRKAIAVAGTSPRVVLEATKGLQLSSAGRRARSVPRLVCIPEALVITVVAALPVRPGQRPRAGAVTARRGPAGAVLALHRPCGSGLYRPGQEPDG